MAYPKKVAYVSPMPPKPTGIAEYSQHLCEAFEQYWPALFIDIFDTVTAPTTSRALHVRPLLPLFFERHRHQEYQEFIYHIGNQPDFHNDIRHLARLCPGIVVLHDTVLYYLMAGYGHGGLWQALAENGYGDAYRQVAEIERNSLSRDLRQYQHPERLPLLQTVLRNATQIVVHSHMAADNVRASGYLGPIHVMPLLSYPIEEGISTDTFSHPALRACQAEKIPNQYIIVSLFGFGGATKRASEIFQAIKQLPDSLRQRIRLLTVGTDLYRSTAEMAGIGDCVVSCGYVSDADYQKAMAFSDIVINLRYPSMGETSAVQVQAMAAGKPTLVSDHGWFKELPEAVVWKIPVDQSEVDAIAEALQTLAFDETKRLGLGQRAADYAHSAHNPERVVDQWQAILEAQEAE